MIDTTKPPEYPRSMHESESSSSISRRESSKKVSSPNFGMHPNDQQNPSSRTFQQSPTVNDEAEETKTANHQSQLYRSVSPRFKMNEREPINLVNQKISDKKSDRATQQAQPFSSNRRRPNPKDNEHIPDAHLESINGSQYQSFTSSEKVSDGIKDVYNDPSN